MRQRAMVLSMLLIFPALLTAAAFAPDPAGNARIEATRVVEGDAFVAGNNVANRGQVRGDLYIAGGNVTNDGQVGGDVLAAGADVNLDGTVEGDARVGGGNVRLIGEVRRNLTVGSGTLLLAPGSRVGGNLVAGGGDLRLEGEVGGDAMVGAGTLTVAGSIGGDLRAEVEELVILPDARIQGDLTYTSARQADIPPGTVAGRVEWKRAEAPAGRARNAPWWQVLLGARLVGTAGFLLVGLALALAFPGFLPRAAEQLSARPWTALGYGLAVLVLVPITAVILMVTLVGLPAGLLALFLYVPLLYLSRLVAGYWLGRRVLRGRAGVWPLLLGSLVVVALSWLPWVGWLAGLVATVLGLGVFWMLFLENRRGRPAATLGG